MSEIIAQGDWADPEVMRQYRGIVQAANEEWLSLHPNACRRLELRRPEDCAHAYFLLDDDSISLSEVSSRTGLDQREVGQLIFRRPVLWEKRKKSLAVKSAYAAEMIADATIQKANSILEDSDTLAATPIKDLALAFGIMNDKAASLNGEASVTIEHRSGPTIEDALKFREEIRQRLADKAKTEAIDV